MIILYFLKQRDNSDPAWFSFILTFKKDAPFTREELTGYLNDKFIETRNLFAGNIIRQPAFENKDYRIADHLNNSDYIMNNTFFLGTYPGNSPEKLAYIEKVIDEFYGKVSVSIIKKYKAKVEKITNPLPDIYTVSFSSEKRFKYLPGQFLPSCFRQLRWYRAVVGIKMFFDAE